MYKLGKNYYLIIIIKKKLLVLTFDTDTDNGVFKLFEYV